MKSNAALAFLALAAAAPAAAQAPDALQLQATYGRLCGPTPLANAATCEAMAKDIRRASGTFGWAGISVDLAGNHGGAYVLATDPDGSARAAGLKAGDIVVAIDGERVADGKAFEAAMQETLPGQAVVLLLARQQPTELKITMGERIQRKPLRNAERQKPRGTGLGAFLYGDSTKDPIRVGEVIEGVLEASEPPGTVRGTHFDAYLVEKAAAGRNLAVIVEPAGAKLTVWVQQYGCAGAIPQNVSATTPNAQGQLSLLFTATAGCSVLHVVGPVSAKPYRIHVRDQTPTELARWQAHVRETQLAEQQRRQQQANQPSMFEAALRGLAMGLSGYEGPLMNSDGSAPNTLDVLNAANARLAQQNAESKARLDATIAYAQREGARQQREREARAEAERQAAAQARAQQQVAAAQARVPAQTPAGQRTAGQGQLGQTPLGGFPAPVAAPTGKAAPTQLAQQQAGRAQICLEGRVLGAHNVRCEEPAKPDASTRVAGTPGGGTTGGGTAGGRGVGAPGGGGTTGGGSLPPGPRAPGQPPGGGGAVEYVQRLEGITLCELTGPQAQFKNWRCTGPLQMNYVNFEKANWTSAMLMTCGGRGPVRDLGTAGGYRAFGCGHAIDGAFHSDVPARFGVSYVPGRITYRCRKDRTSCVQ